LTTRLRDAELATAAPTVKLLRKASRALLVATGISLSSYASALDQSTGAAAISALPAAAASEPVRLGRIGAPRELAAHPLSVGLSMDVTIDLTGTSGK
jgi:hypothetical protein